MKKLLYILFILVIVAGSFLAGSGTPSANPAEALPMHARSFITWTP